MPKSPRVFVVREIAPNQAELVMGEGERTLVFPLSDGQVRLLELQAGDIRRARDSRQRRAC